VGPGTQALKKTITIAVESKTPIKNQKVRKDDNKSCYENNENV